MPTACGQLLRAGRSLGHAAVMDPGEAVRRCGGRARWSQLRTLGVTRRELRVAVAEERVSRTGRGRYRWGQEEGALDVAHSLAAVLSHRSAALHHGLEVATAPERPEVVVRRNRRLQLHHHRRAHVRYRDPDDTSGGVTTVLRTVLDCARDLPFAEALAVADSALRHEQITQDQLVRGAAALQGPGSARARHVAEQGSGLAANPFESVLRALAMEAGLDVRPQFQISEPGVEARVDLADEGRSLVIEGEGFEHHGSRKGFRRDVRRYTRLVVHAWTVLRFTWEEVMLQPEYVLWALTAWRRRHDRPGAEMPDPPPVLARLA